MCANQRQDAALTTFSGYDEEEIMPVFDLLIDYLQAPVAHEALFKKYASKKFMKGMSMDQLFILCMLTISSIDHGS